MPLQQGACKMSEDQRVIGLYPAACKVYEVVHEMFVVISNRLLSEFINRILTVSPFHGSLFYLEIFFFM